MGADTIKPEKKPEGYNPSWNPLTQAKFIYEINRQTGRPISWAEAYKTAELAVQTESEQTKSNGR